MQPSRVIEALLFASEAPLSAADLARADDSFDEESVEALVQQLRAEYESEARAFGIFEIAGGYQILTRPEYSSVLERFDTVPAVAHLSTPALETLAIIAYRQPIGRAEIEEIRGVGSAHVLRTLQEMGLVEAVARGEGLGRPLLYGTTPRFLDHFGFDSLGDLPRPDELPVVLAARRPPGARPDSGGAPDFDREPQGGEPTAGDAPGGAAPGGPSPPEPSSP
jgi:segregation and condensation protein B